MRIVHAVVTEAFAGTERYVALVSAEQARRGHDVVVISGQALRRYLSDGVQWKPGGTRLAALRSAAISRCDVAHAHLTDAEAALALTKSVHGGRFVATRHIAAPRGSSASGRLLSPLIRRQLDRQWAISAFVATAVEDPGVPVVWNGVEAREVPPGERRNALMLQRLEAEKSSAVGIKAFLASQLPSLGWRLLVAGAGAERAALEALVRDADGQEVVRFLGHVDAEPLWDECSVLIAPAPAEPFGLSVVEAMASGAAVVACGRGGHLESLGDGYDYFFEPDDVAGCTALLDQLASPSTRASVGRACRKRQQEELSVAAHVDHLEAQYALALGAGQ